MLGFDVLACADGAAGPLYFDRLDKSIVVYAENGGEFALRAVTGAALDCVCLCSQCGDYADLCTDAVSVTRLTDELNLDPRLAVATVVSEEVCGSVGGRNEQIPIAIVVDIAIGTASSNHWL